MDINTLRNLSPVLMLLAFIGICWWAFAPSRRKRFEEAAKLPFADEPDAKKKTAESDEQQKSTESGSTTEDAKKTASDQHKQG